MKEYELPAAGYTMGFGVYYTGAAFTALYESTQLIVFRYIYALHGGPREDVEDLWIETYLRAWRGRYRFVGGEGAALGWLLKIARHLVIDQHRRRGPRITALSDSLPAPFEDTPEHQLVQKEEAERLNNCLAVLSFQQREMVVLRYMMGWRVNQIARHLRMRENTVSVTLQRALLRMAQQQQKE